MAVNFRSYSENLSRSNTVNSNAMVQIAVNRKGIIYGINGCGKSNLGLAIFDVLTLMELFALPYKAVVLRLTENHNITVAKAKELIGIDASFVLERMKLTGKALGWQQNSKELIYFGSLLDNMEYNSENELLTDIREESDNRYLEKIRKGFLEQS